MSFTSTDYLRVLAGAAALPGDSENDLLRKFVVTTVPNLAPGLSYNDLLRLRAGALFHAGDSNRDLWKKIVEAEGIDIVESDSIDDILRKFIFSIDPTFGVLVKASTPLAAPVVTLNDIVATLTGTVNPNGSLTTYYFEWGTDTSYGTQSDPATAGSGVFPVDVEHILAGLDPENTYHFRLVATNQGGTAVSADVEFTTPAAPVAPSVYTGAVTAPGQDEAEFNGFVNPNGLATTYYFEYGLTTAYGSQTTPTGAGSGTSTVPIQQLLVTGLQTNVTYHVRLVATSSGGTTLGNDVTFNTLPNAPTVVTLSPTTIGTTTARFAGTINSKGAPTSYFFQYGLTASYGLNSPTAFTLGESVATQYTRLINGLQPNTTYHYRIRATNSGGTDTGLDVQFTTVPLAPIAITLDAFGIDVDSAFLNAHIEDQGASTTYQFEWGLTGSFGNLTDSTAFVSSPVSVEIMGLSANTKYHYRIRATNAGGTTVGSPKTFTTDAGISTAPDVTTEPATNVTESGATVNGTVDNHGASTTYYFEYGLTASYGSQTTPTAFVSSPVSANITGLDPEVMYHFRLVATNAGGTSNGDDATFTTDGAFNRLVENGDTRITEDGNTREYQHGTATAGHQQITDLTLATVVSPFDLIETVSDPAGSPASKKATLFQSPFSIVLDSSIVTSGATAGPGATTASLLASHVGSLVIPANTLQAGAVLYVELQTASTGSGGGSLTQRYRLLFNGTAIATSGTHLVSSGVTVQSFAFFFVQFKSAGASAAWRSQIRGEAGTDLTNVVASGTVDSTADITLAVQVESTTGTATTSNISHVCQISIQQPGQ